MPSAYADVPYNTPSKLDLLWAAFQQNKMPKDSKLQGKSLGEAVFGYPGEHGPANPDRAWKERGDAFDTLKRFNEGTNPDGSPMGDGERMLSLLSAPTGGMGRGVMAAKAPVGAVASHVDRAARVINSADNYQLPPIGHNGGPTIYSDPGAGRLPSGEMRPDIRRLLEQQGHLESGSAPMGARGQKLGVPTPFSKKLKAEEDYLRELDRGLISTPSPDLAPQKWITPEDLEGKTALGIWGDRTGVADITQVGGVPIDPYSTGGGMNYTRDMLTGDWASGEGAIGGLLTHINKLKDDGHDVVGGFAPYAGTGSDYSTQTIDMFYRINDTGRPMSRKVKKVIRDSINEKVAKENATKKKGSSKLPKFPDINSEEAKQYFKDYPSARKYFIETIDNSKFREMETAPDAVKIRHAITDPDLKDNIRGSVDPLVGQSFVDLSGDAIVRRSDTLPKSHETYSHDVKFGADSPTDVGAENYMGGWDVPQPMSKVYSDWVGPRRAAGIPAHQDVYEIRKSPGVAAQKFTPKVVDNLMKGREDRIRYGLLNGFSNRRQGQQTIRYL